MNDSIAIVNPLTEPNWDQLLLAHSGHSFFHSSIWAKTLAASYGFNPVYFTRYNGSRIEELIPVMEINNLFMHKKGVSLPFSDMSEPMTVSNDVFENIIAYGERKHWKSFELRGNLSTPNPLAQAASGEFYNHTLALQENPDAVFKGFSNGNKGNIKKAARENVAVTISTSMESLKAFFQLHSLTRKRHGSPPQPFAFFKQVHDNILQNGNGFIVLATHDKRPIAGAMFFYFGSMAVYKYAASDLHYQGLRANNLVMWEAIQWFCKNKVQRMVMGRTEKSNDGLRHYKAGWGAKEELLRYYTYDFSTKQFLNEDNGVPGLYTTIFKKLPLPVLNAIGALVYKYVA